MSCTEVFPFCTFISKFSYTIRELLFFFSLSLSLGGTGEGGRPVWVFSPFRFIYCLWCFISFELGRDVWLFLSLGCWFGLVFCCCIFYRGGEGASVCIGRGGGGGFEISLTWSDKLQQTHKSEGVLPVRLLVCRPHLSVYLLPCNERFNRLSSLKFPVTQYSSELYTFPFLSSSCPLFNLLGGWFCHGISKFFLSVLWLVKSS